MSHVACDRENRPLCRIQYANVYILDFSRDSFLKINEKKGYETLSIVFLKYLYKSLYKAAALLPRVNSKHFRPDPCAA